MPGGCQYRTWITRTKSVCPRLLPMLTAAGKVTILLLMMAGPSALWAQDANGVDLHVFEFTSEFHMPLGRGRLDGLMACSGSQHRIAIYWNEPALFRDNASFLRYSDFISAGEVM